MEELDLIAIVAERLHHLDVSYMVTGSVASSYYGVPRATHDIDLVVAITVNDLHPLEDAFHEDFYVSDMESAMKHQQMFNLIHQASQLKLDCWVLRRNEEYHRASFGRRRQIVLGGIEVSMIAPEDLIVSKLLWHRESPSDVHLRDIRGIMKVQGSMLDRRYLDSWCQNLSIASLWNELKLDLS